MSIGVARQMSREAEDIGGGVLSLFYLWTFVLTGRPQDLIPFLGVFRPAMILCVLMCVCLLAQKAWGRISLPNKQLTLFMFFVGILALSIPFSYYPWSSFIALFGKYINAVIFIICFYALIDTAQRLRATLLSVCIGLLFYGLFSLATGHIIGNRLTFGVMFDPNDLAFFVVSLLAFNFLFIDARNPWPVRLVCLANLVVGPVIVLMTGSRGGFVALAIMSFMLIAMKNQTVKPAYRALLAVLLLVVAVSVGSFLDLSRFDTLLDVKEDYNLTDTEGRWEVWKSGLRLMAEHPFTGVGMDCFGMAVGLEREERGVSGKWQDAHNSWVQVGTETGLAGFILFGLLNLNAYRSFNRARRKGRGELQAMGEMARIGFAGHFASAMFLTQAYSAYWAFYIGLSAVIIRLLRDQENGQTA